MDVGVVLNRFKFRSSIDKGSRVSHRLEVQRRCHIYMRSQFTCGFGLLIKEIWNSLMPNDRLTSLCTLY